MNDSLSKSAIIIISLIFSLGLIAGGVILTWRLMHQEGKGGYDSDYMSELIEEEITAEEIPEPEVIEEEHIEFQEELLHTELTYYSYRVKQGDMIGYIADAFNVTQDTIISVNQIKQSRLIQVGQYLRIPSLPGILYTVKTSDETPETIAKKFKVNAQKCARINGYEPEERLHSGITLFVPDAKLDWVTRQEINGDLFIKPVHGYFYTSSVYGWRENPFDSSKRTYHNGIDMACTHGTSVYAALAGKVTTTGFNDTYGNYIIVTHHSGYKTLYAHLSAVLCVKGQNVTTETRIGRVGSTGKSTGSHLHFTVYKNGKTVNPANLWK